jgi:thiamine pyrophosphokinase
MELGVCHIVGAAPGSLEGLLPGSLPQGDLLLAADAGWRAIEGLGLKPDCVIGDFDSSPPPEQYKTLRLNPVKDVTDTFAALEYAKGLGYRCFRLYGVLGSLGHSAANLQLLAALARDGFEAVLAAKGTRVRALHNGGMALRARDGRRVSVLAFGGRASGVCLGGMRYPLSDAELDCFFPLGVSNEISGEEGSVSVKQGTLLIIQEDE